MLIGRPVHRAQHRLDGREIDVRIDAGAPDRFDVAGFDLDEGERAGLGAAAEALLPGGGDFELGCSRVFDERIREGGDGTVAGAGDADFLAILDQTAAAGEHAIDAVGVKVVQGEGRLALDVFLPEHVLQFSGADLAAELVHDVVGQRAKLALHVFGQLDAEFAFEKVGDAAFAALRVHADDLAVLAADVRG